MRVFNLLTNFNTKNCSYENEFGWFWLIDPRYVPIKKHPGCYRVYSIYKYKSKGNGEEGFMACIEKDPILYHTKLSSLITKIELYDTNRRYQG